MKLQNFPQPISVTLKAFAVCVCVVCKCANLLGICMFCWNYVGLCQYSVQPKNTLKFLILMRIQTLAQISICPFRSGQTTDCMMVFFYRFCVCDIFNQVVYIFFWLGLVFVLQSQTILILATVKVKWIQRRNSARWNEFNSQWKSKRASEWETRKKTQLPTRHQQTNKQTNKKKSHFILQWCIFSRSFFFHFSFLLRI